MRRWPLPLIRRAVEIERERAAERELEHLRLAALVGGLKLGRKYIDPANPSDTRRDTDPYYSLQPLIDAETRLEHRARPWAHTPEALIAQREAEEDAAFDAMFRAAALHA